MTDELQARPARPTDAPEAVRLARVMFESMGADVSDPSWERDGRRHFVERLGVDLAVFVVDHPQVTEGLVASAAGTVCRRLPTPFNPSGSAGYVQWVCTDAEFRGRGLGRAVMSSLVDWFDDHGVATVELHSTPVAERLYLSLGFDDSGPRALRRPRW